MVAIIQASSLLINEEGQTALQIITTWANPAHDVRIYLRAIPALPRQGKVPLFYATLLQTFNGGGVNITFERAKEICVGYGVGFNISNTSGQCSVLVYRRRNNIPGVLSIDTRVVNFSI